MYHHTAINVLGLLQNMSNNKMNDMQLEVEFKKIEKEFQVKYEELVDLHNRMVLFQIDIEKNGGMRAYEKSAITWLKSELELLYEVYQFCQRHGLNILSISKYVSKNELNLFPKTESQLQNTYYKLKKREIAFENIEKQKPGRKRKYIPVKEAIVARKQGNEYELKEEIQHKEDEKNLVTVISGIVDNFETINQCSERKEDELHQFMEGIYKLSSMAAGRSREAKNTRSLEGELQSLQLENERLKREKEELVQDIKGMTQLLIHFITSSDIDQIRKLPTFVQDCKMELHKLGLYNAQDGKMKIMVDRSGQVMTVTQ
ncbi:MULTISPECIES: DNA-binding domain-containing protein [Bacillus]|uniref:DNA-binding domain-containing protein n=2 Tax=Bacillus cereus group TaxID=86661 RepID=A0AAW7ND91_BACCE|nr:MULTISPECIES: DNA-binding domain-containing protein [Bacillus]HDR5349394.1 DNA-binding domain-containing protein [Bacillus thuringiensis]MCJ0846769.1 DNA-binding domain-containing protein [Bacillus cereus]MCU5644805.1 DNA-binding domain-containing protein [Bacillus cereus]MDA2047416.1 DNA-binding domain-containing protein [Bacillus cereus]MDA4078693.1 DNA-binding domain-containing protein [Bacillus cereus]